MENKRVWKFVLAFVAIFFVAFLGWFALGFWGQDAREAREAEEYFKNMEEQYKNDPYGGETPEETIALFIDALEKGDIDLASKYFVVEEQEETLRYLENKKKEEGLTVVISEAKRLEKSTQEEERAFFVLTTEGSLVKSQVILVYGVNNKWKILDL